jgi:predicted alpha/beta hydrolase family esterase
MKDVLFVQGAGAGVHADWDVHLVESLRHALGPRYTVRYPRMPHEADPTLATWRPVLEHELAALRPGAILVGHSVGGTMALHVLADAAMNRAGRWLLSARHASVVRSRQSRSSSKRLACWRPGPA